MDRTSVLMSSLDPETNAGERLLLRTEYQAGALHMASLTIARRRTEEEKYAPQTQIVYGKWKFTNEPLLISLQPPQKDH